MRRFLAILSGMLLALVVAVLIARTRAPQASSDPEPGPDSLAKTEPTSAAPALAQPPSLPTRVTAAEDSACPEGCAQGFVLAQGTDRPVPYAELIFMSEGAVQNVRGDAEGRFLFRGPKAGAYRLVSLSAPGYARYGGGNYEHARLEVRLESGKTLDGLVLRLDPLDRCVGQVVFPDGGAAPGTKVTVDRVAEGSLGPPSFETVTDANGGFAAPCRRGSLFDAALADYRAAAVIADPKSENPLVMRLYELPDAGARQAGTGRIAGHLTDTHGLPLADLRVSASHYELEVPSGGVTRTGEDGRFAFTGLLDAGYWVKVVSAGGFIVASKPDVPSGTEDLELVIPDPSRITGQVREAGTGEPVRSFKVGIEARDSTRHISFINKTILDPDGRFEVPDVPEGGYSIEVEAKGYQPGHQDIDVQADQTASVTVSLERGTSIAGTVIDARTEMPIQGAHVAQGGGFDLFDPLASPPFAVTGADGRFVLEGVSRDKQVTASAAGYRSHILAGTRHGDVKNLRVALAPDTEDGGSPTEYAGIGLSWGAHRHIYSVRPGGPADRAGIQKEDQLLAIDGAGVTDDDDTQDLVDRIRGEPDTPVALSFRRTSPDGGFTDTDYVLVRERIPDNWMGGRR